MSCFSDILILAPIRGITNRNFRNELQRTFGGISSGLAPFITTREDGKVSEKLIQDTDPKSNLIESIPQILTKSASQFHQVATILKNCGHKKINLNLGCPYPMVATKGKGSGMLSDPKKVEELLAGILKVADYELSVKLRLGRESSKEFEKLIPILNDLSIKDITIHPRTGIQMYGGKVDIESFDKILPQLNTIPCYNGDLTTLEDYTRLKGRYPQITRWMIGRGALINPNLFTDISDGKGSAIDLDKIKNFIISVGEHHLNTPNGKSDFLHRMRESWEYLCKNFEQEKKVYKLITKSKSIDHYNDNIKKIFSGQFQAK
ncbi:MAG: tRNA-dihydrouridine synthase family protein [Bacteriovoracaceae bacterium]|nr:tRNA-dihydrouridine synthase family protein [Bacteriovoracaceae bacterium]